MVGKKENVTVIGSGEMGHGIAQSFAMAGYEVTVVDVSDEILRKAKQTIAWSLGRLAEKGKIRRENIDVVMARINFTTSYEHGIRDARAMKLLLTTHYWPQTL